MDPEQHLRHVPVVGAVAGGRAEKSSQRDHLLEFRNLFGSRHGALLAQGAAGAKEGKDAKGRRNEADVAMAWPGPRCAAKG